MSRTLIHISPSKLPCSTSWSSTAINSHPFRKELCSLLVSVLYRTKKPSGFVALGHSKKHLASPGGRKRHPTLPGQRKGQGVSLIAPRSVSTFSISAAREGKTFAVFGRTRHRKSLSDRDKGSIEVGELQFWAKAQGRERKKKQGAFSAERDPCWGRVDWAKLWTRGSLNKACWNLSSPVGKWMLLSSLGEKTELFDTSFLINPFCL